MFIAYSMLCSSDCSGECQNLANCHGYTILDDGHCWFFKHGPNADILNGSAVTQLDWELHIRKSYAENGVKNAIFGVISGTTLTNWTRMIDQEFIMDQPSEDFCAYFTWHLRGRRLFAVDGNR